MEIKLGFKGIKGGKVMGRAVMANGIRGAERVARGKQRRERFPTGLAVAR
jgi:hypothetical protein